MTPEEEARERIKPHRNQQVLGTENGGFVKTPFIWEKDACELLISEISARRKAEEERGDWQSDLDEIRELCKEYGVELHSGDDAQSPFPTYDHVYYLGKKLSGRVKELEKEREEMRGKIEEELTQVGNVDYTEALTWVLSLFPQQTDEKV